MPDQIDANSRQKGIFYDFVYHLFVYNKTVISTLNMSKFNTLLKLARKGQFQEVKDILQSQNVNVNQIDPKSGKTLLHISIQNSDLDLFNVLAQCPGINLQQPDKAGELPLEMAVRLNDVTLVNRLLQLKVNIRKKNKDGQTVIYGAIRNQTSKQIIKRLFQHFDFNQKIDFYGSYLNLAIVAAQNDNFYLLIQQFGVKYLTKDDQDNTCLILAVKQNKGDFVVAILQKLVSDPIYTPVEKQFFFNAQNKEGNTALHEACLKGHQTITQKLQRFGQKLGVDLTLKNKKGQTVEAIKLSLQKNRLNEIQLQKKRQQERVIRRKQKQEQKIRLREQEQRQRVEQKRRKKEEQQRMQIEARVNNESQKQKTIWIAAIVFLVLLAGMYLVITNTIQKKKVPTFD